MSVLKKMSGENRYINVPFLVGGSVAVLGTFACWLMLFLYPLMEDRQHLRLELSQIAEMRDNKSTILGQLESTQRESTHWKEKNEQRLRRCASTSSDAEFLEWLHRQADTCELTIRDFRPGVRMTRGQYEARGISVSAQGTYEAVCRLMDQLRNCPQMFRVTGLDIVTRDEDGVGMTLTLQGQLLKDTAGRLPPNSVKG